MQLEDLEKTIVGALQDLKAIDLQIIDVSNVASFTDRMIIASGSSTRQVKALAEKAIECCKAEGVKPIGVEGDREAEWILVDFGDAVVHVMLPAMRDFYELEKLWTVEPEVAESSV